ncbi:MAG TPA: type 1 glutamine amidotransferase [Dissulfurispiraceae bacterium]|nr:type 1 glutamine amidotransferase [Dissulfurispiraceae bacterium]
MSVLILKNISSEGPGTVAGYLAQHAIPYTIVDLYAGEPLPATEEFDTLVMLGGPMSVNDDDSYSHIRQEYALTRRFIAQRKPVFGICLGAQIMAKALGAKVVSGPEKEIGWLDITLTTDAFRDFRMLKLADHPQGGDVSQRFKVFHWHGETFELPNGAVRLAASDLYSNQAFRFGSNAYAFQFHIEVTREMVYDWLKAEPIDQTRLASDTEQLYDDYQQRALAFYDAFFSPDRKITAQRQEVRYEKN